MSEWLDSLQIKQHGWKDSRSTWITLAPLRYRSAMLGATIVVPAEFVTDLASVPRLPFTWLVAGGRGCRSALPHDYGYQKGEIPLCGGGALRLTRKEFDALFAESLAADEHSGTNAVTRWLMWTAVRVGGWAAWQGQAERQGELNPIWSNRPEGWPTPDREPELFQA